MIIHSLLDTDLYKLTMMQVVLHQFPGATVVYRFKCRSADIDFRFLAAKFQEEIDKLCELKFSEDELEYLKKISFFKNDFIDFLRIFKLNSTFIHIDLKKEFELQIEGPWLHTILFEVPLLAILSELYFKIKISRPSYQEGKRKLSQKIEFIKSRLKHKDFKFTDFGTRRRYSFAWQEYVIERLCYELPDNFIGTSNVFFAKQFNLTAVGTMSHEYLQACQALGPRLVLSQQFALEKWAQEYRGELGIALSDVAGLKAFLRDFDLYFCKLFDGARHDSGDPFMWGEAMIYHYQQNGIDPKTKHLVFSDNLTIPLAIKIFNHFKDRINVMFGVGTNLMNDVGVSPLPMVIKMIYCNGQPVAKITDTPEKTMCPDPSYLAYLKKVFEVNND